MEERASSSRQEGRRRALLPPPLHTAMEIFMQGAKRLKFGPVLVSGVEKTSKSAWSGEVDLRREEKSFRVERSVVPGVLSPTALLLQLVTGT